jgi:hypothetical protein
MTDQDSINIWIVEDDPQHALDAKVAVLDAAKEANLKVELYWDESILWDSLLSVPPPSQFRPEFRKPEVPPTIVILDLFAPGGFLARDFLLRLRQFEDSGGGVRSWVILWSVYAGLDAVQDLIREEPKRDRKVVFSGSKQQLPLREKLASCLASWKEDRFL